MDTDQREHGRSPRVTVLMPIHNQADLLSVSLGSVLAQTFSDLQVLVVGDGCTDASEEVTRSSGDKRVTWLGFPKAPGFGYANRQRALASARGELVAYLAPDDLWAPDHLETLVATLDSESVDLAFSRPLIVRGNGALNAHYFPFDIWLPPQRAALKLRLFFLSPTQVVHTRAILDRAGGWDRPLLRFGDVDLWMRMHASEARVRFVDRITVCRLPSLNFSRTATTGRDLHAHLAQKLLRGQRDALVAASRQSRTSRIAGWLGDAVTVGRAKGPAFISVWRKRTAYSVE